jgi:hypothetical protein
MTKNNNVKQKLRKIPKTSEKTEHEPYREFRIATLTENTGNIGRARRNLEAGGGRRLTP